MTTRRTHTTRHGLLVVFFALYLALLTWIILWKLDLPHIGSGDRSVKLVPYVTDGWHGASEPREVLANVLLFTPLGIYARLLTRRVLLPVLGAATLSAGFEVAQYVLRVGSTDLTDVLANTAGAIAGVVVASLALALLGARWGRRLLVGVSATGTVAAVALSAAFFASPMRYGPPDVACAQDGTCRVGHDLVR